MTNMSPAMTRSRAKRSVASPRHTAVEDLTSHYLRLHLLPSAPSGLIDTVYERMSEHLRAVVAMNPQRRPGLEALDDAYTRLRAQRRPARPLVGLSPSRTPWELLHVTRDAPADVLDAAYTYWKSRRAPAARLFSMPSGFVRALLFTLRSVALPLRRRRPTRPQRPPAVAAFVSGVNGAAAHSAVDTASALLVPDAAPERPLAISERPLRIGSEPDFEIVVPDPLAAVARVEARIWLQDGRSFLHAVAGGEAILVNDEPLTWAVLEDGDRVRVGKASFTFRAAPAPFA